MNSIDKIKYVKEHMFSNIGTMELLIIVIILLVLFGGKKLPELARGVTQATKEFNKGLNSEDEKNSKESSKDSEEKA